MFSAKRFYRVVGSLLVYELVGVSESNTYVGSSRMLGNVYRPLKLSAGDEIHLLPGGRFAVVGGEPREFVFKISEKHPFEKEYGGAARDALPNDGVVALAPIEAARVQSYRPNGGEHPVVAPGRFVGRSIDSILED